MTQKRNLCNNNHNTSNDGKKEEARKAMPVKRIPAELVKPAQDKKPPETPLNNTKENI